jgi:hypothetical protein
MITKKDFYPKLSPLGKGGNASNCRIFAFSTSLKFLQSFFLPSVIHLNRINNFTFDFNTMILTNNINSKSIDFTNRELTKYANGAPWEENKKPTANGAIYESELAFNVDTDNYERFINTVNSNNKYTILLLIYNNGGARLVGNYNGATVYEEKFQSGSQKTVQIRQVKYSFESFHPAYWVKVLPKEDKDWIEWWTYKDDYFTDLASALVKLNAGIFFDANNNPITVQVAEHKRYTESFMGDPNYVHSIVRFKLPKNSKIRINNNGGGTFSGGSYERFLDYSSAISVIECDNEFQLLYSCLFGDVQIKGNYNFIQSYTNNLKFGNITITGEGNFSALDHGMTAKNIEIVAQGADNFNNSKLIKANDIKINDSANNNLSNIDGLEVDNILLLTSTDNIRNSKNIKVLNNTVIEDNNLISFVECNTLDLGNLTIRNGSRNNVMASRDVKFKNLIIDNSTNNLLENVNIEFGGTIGATVLGEGIVNNANIIANTGVARFLAIMLSNNNGANEGDVADIINPANNSFSQVLFNL